MAEKKIEYFTVDLLPPWFDGRIYMRSVPGKLDWMELTHDLPCGNSVIPSGYRWNGASVGILRKIPFLGFPKWKHPISTCRHDWRCEKARTKHEREIADLMFKSDVGVGGTWWEQTKGYIGVRIGSIF